MKIVALEALVFGLNRLADAAAEQDCDLILLTRDRSLYSYELSQGRSDPIKVIDVDTFDNQALQSALTAIGPIDGLINQTDTWSLPALDVAASLGLPHQNADAVRLVRDKTALRNHLFAHKLSAGKAIPIDTDKGLSTEELEDVHFPAIVKERAGTGSRNVWRAEDAAHAAMLVRAAQDNGCKADLSLEPYFRGTLFSAETLSWDGETRLIGVSSRVMSPEPLFREDAIALPVYLPDEKRQQIESWIRQILGSVNYTQGFAHTEFIMGPNGFEVVEINPRQGGSLMGEAFCRIYKENIYAAHIAMSLGQRPRLMDVPLVATCGYAQAFLYAPKPGQFQGIEGLDALSSLAGHPTFYDTKNTGEWIDHANDHRGRLGVVLAEGETAELALYNALAAANRLSAQIDEENEQLLRQAL